MSLTRWVASWPRWAWYVAAVPCALVSAAAATGIWVLGNDHADALVFWPGWAMGTAVQWAQLWWQDEKQRRARSVARARAEHAAREARIAMSCRAVEEADVEN